MFKTTKYKIVQTEENVYKICQVTYYFGVEWCGEFLNEEFPDYFSAKSLAKKLKNNKEIKLV